MMLQNPGRITVKSGENIRVAGCPLVVNVCRASSRPMCCEHVSMGLQRYSYEGGYLSAALARLYAIGGGTVESCIFLELIPI